MENTLVTYLYRDASNYKLYEETVLEGRITEDEIQEVLGTLDMGEYFIPGQVGLPMPSFSDYNEDDHPWCELSEASFDKTGRSADMTVREFVEAFKNAKREGWQEEKYIF